MLPVDLRKVPAMGVFEWIRQADGSYRPVERIHDAWMRVSEVERLPLGLTAEVLMKLVKGGFVEGGQMAPNSTTVNIMSLLSHLEDTREDPDYWTAERRQRYREGV